MNTMKRIYLIFILALLFAIPVSAQSIMDGAGNVRDLQVNRASNQATISMNIDISKLDVGADETIILTPTINKDQNSVELPSVEILGSRAYMRYLRNKEVPVTSKPFYVERVAKRAERKAGLKQSVQYSATIDLADWMRGSTVTIEQTSCGCHSSVNLGKDDLSRFMQEIYAPKYMLSFVEPEPEPVKVRAESLTAYINFYVDKYDIVENYKNNASELASVINSIQKVDNDEDLTITSITIEGWASPEATEQHNKTLSENRANSLANYVTAKTGIVRETIKAVGCGEDWAGLKREVENTPELLDQKKVLAIIAEQGLTLDQKNKKLEDLVPPTIYQRLLNELYPRLRRNDYRIEYNVRNFNLEEARALVDSDPRKLSVSELYKVAGSYQPNSKEYLHVMEVAAKTYPQIVAAAVNQAGFQISKNDYAGALKTLQASDTNDARVLAAMGYAYVRMGDQQKAREAWEKAAAKGNADAKHNLAELDKHLKSL